MPYRSHVIIDLEQIAREAPLGGRTRRLRTLAFVLAVVLASITALWLILNLAFTGVRHFRPHPYQPPL